MDDEAVWKRRFLIFAAIRLAGLAIFFLGIAIAYSGLVRPGGWPGLGAAVAIIGVVDAVFASRLLRILRARKDQD